MHAAEFFVIITIIFLVAQNRDRGFELGPDSSPVLLSKVNCIGTELRILDCNYNGPSSADRHNKDTGVFCFDKPSSKLSYLTCAVMGDGCSFSECHLILLSAVQCIKKE